MKSFNFIDAYETYASGNEASPTFHRWAAYSVLGSIIGRRVWFDQVYFKLYPNLYIVFVGEPGDKKTTAVNIAAKFVEKADVPMAPSSITREAIAKIMDSENDSSFTHVRTTVDNKIVSFTQLSFYASEIVTLLSAGGNALGLIEFFTDIYDKDDKYQVMTKNKGDDFIAHPYVTITACMTPEQTGQMLKQAIITGGFSRRVIFIYGKTKTKGIPLPKLTPEQSIAHKQLTDHLPLIKSWRGEFKLSPEAEVIYEAWYHKKHEKQAAPGSAAYKNWLRSADALLFKLCMLDVIAEFAEDRATIIKAHNINRVIKMLADVEPDIDRVFAGIGKHDGAELAQKIVEALRDAPGQTMGKKQLMAMFYAMAETRRIEETLQHLVNIDRIVLLSDPTRPQLRSYRLIR